MDKKIIVGIDFSKSSIVALRLAIDIANRIDAEILMCWVETLEFSSKEAEENLVSLSCRFKDQMGNKNLNYIICHGKVWKALSQLADLEKPHLIVMGTHGMGGFDEKYAGQNVFKVIIESKRPCLVVRESFNFEKDLEKIVLPIDSSRDTRQKVPWTIEFARMFPKTKINILGIQTSSIKSVRNEVISYVESVKRFLDNAKLPYTEDYSDSDNVTTTTIDYAKEINADLIIITTEQEKAFANFFLGTYAQQMLNLSPLPVMVVPTTFLGNIAK